MPLEPARFPFAAPRARGGRAARRLALIFAGAFALALASLAPSEAKAQQKTFYLDRLFMAGAPEDGIAVWRPHMAEKTRFYGQLGVGFGLHPFRTENHVDNAKRAALVNAARGAPVEAQLVGYADIGVELLERLAFQVQFPFVAYQQGNPTSLTNAGVPGNATTEPAAPMDLRLDARLIGFRSDSRAFKIGLMSAVWLPTGNELAWAGDKGTSGAIAVAAEYDFRSVVLALNTGLHFRPVAGLNDFRLSDEWRLGLGAFVPLRDGTVRLGGEVFASTGLGDGTFFDGDNTPVEWMFEGRVALDGKRRGWFGAGGGTRLSAGYAPDFRVVALVGSSFGVEDSTPVQRVKRVRVEKFADHGADSDKDGLPDDVDLCPNEAEDKKPPYVDDGCPAPPDRDGDGVADANDKCPDQPEDLDTIDDLDGCPEDDVDKDGVADASDACPREPGEPSADPAKNGCPQFIRRVTGSSEIQILQQIQFATGSAKILVVSYKILDEVAKLMRANPDIKHVAIEGHTDDRGPDDLNMRLSNDRAHSVMQHLINLGIEESRLSAAGFGETRPIADNQTEEGRQKNRRVEFHIRDVGPGQEPAPAKPGEQPPAPVPPGPAEEPPSPAPPGSP